MSTPTEDNVKSQAIKATAQGGGGRFKYASMSDIVAAGYKIPATRVKPVFNNNGDLVAEYMEWYDERIKNWLTGSRIVEPEQSNLGSKTQQYGAALSYARRYTIYMALGLVTDDDAKMEDLAGQSQPSRAGRPASAKQLNYLKRLAGDKYQELLARYNGNVTSETCSKLIDWLQAHEKPADNLQEMASPISADDLS